MNILHLNSSDHGGAARAMVRLNQGLQRQGHNSQILVGQRMTQEPGIEDVNSQAQPFRSFVDKVLDPIALSLELRFSLNARSHRNSWHVPKMPIFQHADVINLHNLHGGYFNYRALTVLARHKPVVWTLHDMWALTGHCAYSYGCERWRTGCYSCPLLREPGRQIVEPAPVLVDHSRAVWESKRDVYSMTPLHVITPSKWLHNLVQESILSTASSIRFIPYGVDLDIFRPLERRIARQALDLPIDKYVVFFSAMGGSDGRTMNGRKGFSHLLQALERLPDSQSIWLLTSGGVTDLERYTRHFNIRQLGHLSDEELQRKAFAAADLFVFPTLADNLPLVLIEALACGTPIVAFDVGGVSELVCHMETGYLARYKDADDLSHGIQVLLQDEGLRSLMSHHCRTIAESEYSLEVQAQRYLDVYEEAIERTRELPHPN